MGKTISFWAYRTLRWAIALIFLYSGFLKLLDPQSFAVIIDAFGIVPENVSASIAVILPIVEILAAIQVWFEISGGEVRCEVTLLRQPLGAQQMARNRLEACA